MICDEHRTQHRGVRRAPLEPLWDTLVLRYLVQVGLPEHQFLPVASGPIARHHRAEPGSSNDAQEVPLGHGEELLYYAGDLALEQIVPRGCVVSLTGCVQEPSGCEPVPCAVG